MTVAQLSPQEKANLRHIVDCSNLRSLPELWPVVAERFPNTTALYEPHREPEVRLTYAELERQIRQFADGLQGLFGLRSADPASETTGEEPEADRLPTRVALFANNSLRWLLADQGILATGACNVVRGADADPAELGYILQDSGSIGLVADSPALLEKLRSHLPESAVAWVVLLDGDTPEFDIPVKTFAQVMERGAEATFQPPKLQKSDLATLLYTSGTTGRPKGVMLSHGNLLHQIEMLSLVFAPAHGTRVLSILPTWHVFERSCEYIMLSQGCTQIYTNLRFFKKDLRAIAPQLIVGVPRLWESLYEGVMKSLREQPPGKQRFARLCLDNSMRYVEARRVVRQMTLAAKSASLGDRLVKALEILLRLPLHAIARRLVYRKILEATGGALDVVVSGGGALAMHVETFFEAMGIGVQVGYGLTETSPVLTVRRAWHNRRGAAGQPVAGTELRIVDPETRRPLPKGQVGLVLARGPQIMGGYFRKPEATQKAIDPDGWFDTGDLGRIVGDTELVLTGRAKDTIVLTNGENIEPQPIENACIRSPYIEQIVLVGQDRKYLGALIVPNLEAIAQRVAEENLCLQLPDSGDAPAEPSPAETNPLPKIDLKHELVQNLIRRELEREVRDRPGFRPDDFIRTFQFVLEPFSPQNGLMTQTMKIKRPAIAERYRDAIENMYPRR